MKAFMDENFLLTNKTAIDLYHGVAKHQPIFDYHCHLNPQEIAENKSFANISEVWLGGDHYKWRAMRSNGVAEEIITGKSADPYQKFVAWAKTVPNLLGNPLYHWTHLELKTYFGVNDVLDEGTAAIIWEKANAKLKTPALSVEGILASSNVYMVGTTDDPADTLEWHKKIKEAGRVKTKVVPSFRPDKAIHIDLDGFAAYIQKLATSANTSIKTLDDLTKVLAARIQFFHDHGCRASDHAFEYVPFVPKPEAEIKSIFEKVMNGQKVNADDADAYKTYVIQFLGREYAKKGWGMQLHIAAMRNNNSRQLAALGPDTGYDAVHDHRIASGLAKFMNSLDNDNLLPKTVLYSLNPKDYYALGTIMGNFQGGGIPGKIQFGSAWWFCDHRDGMEEQMKILGNLGLLPRFIGMLTDSRSFLSYTRHEYFRRILCNILGTWVEEGEIPNQSNLLESTVKNISFENAKTYFGV